MCLDARLSIWFRCFISIKHRLLQYRRGEDEITNCYNQHILNWLDENMDEGPRWIGTSDTAYYLQWDFSVHQCRHAYVRERDELSVHQNRG